MALKTVYVAEDTEGKLYRVRDRVVKDKPCIVWAEDLPHEEAEKLKERVCGREQSRTARLENMDVPRPANAVNPKGQPLAPAGIGNGLVTRTSRPDPDPTIETARQQAMAAAGAVARAAQERAARIASSTILEPDPEITVPDNIDAEIDDLVGDVDMTA